MRFAARAALTLTALLVATHTPNANAGPRANPAPPAAGTSVAASAALISAASKAGLRPEVLALAVRAHSRAVAEGRTTQRILTVIDYSRPSRERRLWVLDLERATVLARELVAHGKNTGEDLARRFSNAQGSYQSSLGTFITGETYQGKHGLSLRLNGIDGALNGNAAARAIVMHGADYVNDAIVAQLGRLGRSEGCPALNPSVASHVIELIRGGTVIFSYYPTPEPTPAV
ncbi:MAG: murein L,D-transpeptidase catalytic domain family protein [Gemmatimonadota bacterium]